MRHIEIKRYAFVELSNEQLIDLCQLYNDTLEKAFIWQNEPRVDLGSFIKMIDVELVYIVYEEKKLVGFLTLYEPDIFIHFLFIDTALQRGGVGSMLLEKIELDFPNKSISLKCLLQNKEALNFYKKKGFSVIETKDELGLESYQLLVKESKADD
ncbi:GNAT family N-acetyltransferase [Vagococcus carniphilus]|uniref:GNAT family N-acetyltransferase n=1 Tax=Vagococcus carniphilus TaxID=218144 RepID=A0AAW8UBB9_9ENTE|nr:GNAT family N-acetyltransferase [Vagococcus carniphilus]MDT2830373.1 GNAT family N-acetyltransferase [Vagococcus carniphilus]MDT2834295.1 GNAT family N-acetyltransferase [Vagococcus carniphilus]MDT2840058.1 GNAT family N-acetyltransferase [Vagococcus carniphilus]MDT2854549.1 GNAT family N-acetyltransferase [Vagococcus carniphilus]